MQCKLTNKLKTTYLDDCLKKNQAISEDKYKTSDFNEFSEINEESIINV
jgi:hypothetical protein